MRKRGIAILLLVVAALLAAATVCYHGAYPSGKRAERYHESTGGGTNEPRCLFVVSDYKGGLHCGPCGIGEAVNWSYYIDLSGVGERFSFQKVDIAGIAPGSERPVAGEVVLDRQKNIVTISLKVARGKSTEDFLGNGTFHLKMSRL
jgi:hypothetical protein